MTTDPIADLLTRIRNAQNARKDTVIVSPSAMKLAILKVLKDRKFIEDFNEVENGDFKDIEITLKPDRAGTAYTRISKPGQRIYISSSSIKKVNGGLGVAIISTSKGVMSGEEAYKLKMGGELLCEVY